MQDALAYCESLVRDADKDRYLATLFAPAARRPDLYALYAFNIEIGRVRELAREPLAGAVRLQWWRDALDGAREAEARAHPVANALRETIARHGLPVSILIDFLEAREFDLYDDPMPSLNALEAYARRTSANLMDLAGRVLADAPPPADLTASAGIGYGLTGLLRSFAYHASQGRIFVPADVLDRHGVEIADVLDGRSSAGLRAALAEMRARARRHLAAFAARAAQAPAIFAPSFLPLALVPLYLARLERDADAPFAPPADVPQWRRQWTLWRAARR